MIFDPRVWVSSTIKQNPLGNLNISTGFRITLTFTQGDRRSWDPLTTDPPNGGLNHSSTFSSSTSCQYSREIVSFLVKIVCSFQGLLFLSVNFVVGTLYNRWRWRNPIWYYRHDSVVEVDVALKSSSQNRLSQQMVKFPAREITLSPLRHTCAYWHMCVILTRSQGVQSL